MDQTEDVDKNDSVHYTGLRDGTIFVVDATSKMFEIDPDTNQTNFEQCLKIYGSILSKKLSWNRRDWMGLMLFGVEKWDRKPIETKYILTLQEFSEIAVNMLSTIMCAYNNEVENYGKLASGSGYPLNDVLWHAARSFDSVKVPMQLRQVVLFTCRDNPFEEDRAEQHSIRLRAKTFSDINVNLRIVGMGNDWNHELFYKDIEMLANNEDREDIKRLKLEDLELQVKFPSRITGHLKWKIGNGVVLRTVISSFSRKTEYLKKAQMSKRTNEILEKHTHWGQSRYFGDPSDDDDDDDPESQVPVKPDGPGHIFKAINFGERMMTFQPEEVKNIRIPLKSGIELLGFKTISLDLQYFIKAPKFIGVEPTATTAEKELFAALLKKCEEKKVMATCVVAHKAGSYLANMIPCIRHSGFYLNRIAYVEQTNNLREYTKPYVYVGGDEGDLELPTDAAGVSLFKKIVGKLRIRWDPFMFKNPKMEAQLGYIETLALDTVAVPTPDTTLPPRDIIVQQLGDLPRRFETIFADSDCAVGEKNRAAMHGEFDVAAARAYYLAGTLGQITYANLRLIARSAGIPVTGTKCVLVDRITEYYRTH